MDLSPPENEHQTGSKNMDEEDVFTSVNENKFTCPICKYTCNRLKRMEKHMKNHRDGEDGDWNCDSCFYQATDKTSLINHIKETPGHTSASLQIPDVEHSNHTCNFCQETFSTKKDLLTHRKIKHVTYKPCRNMSNCTYGDNCFFSHIPLIKAFRCYQCGENFTAKNDMMKHRKRDHQNVKECQQFLSSGNCRFNNNCWWSHDNEVDMDTSENNSANEGFWETRRETEPPLLRPPQQSPNMNSIIKNPMNNNLLIQIRNTMNQIMMNLHMVQ